MMLPIYSLMILAATASSRLKVDGDQLSYDGTRVFLSGANQPWLNYGADFGNNRPTQEDFCTLRDKYLAPVKAAGGHAMRFWLFVEGSGGIPSWSTDPSNGNHVVVNGTDSAGTLAEDMKKYLQVAASMDILIVWTLWNGAVLRDNRTLGMIIEPDGTTLQSFIDNALTPLVIALKDQPGLGGWEIMNEPEGSVLNNEADADACFDTTLLKNTGAGWAQVGKHPLPMRFLQRFVAWQTAAIHAADPAALVTVGSWNAVANTDIEGHRNYWSDECLAKASGSTARPGSTALDFYQIHSYPSNGGFDALSPFAGRNKSFYQLNKPLVVGEFPAATLNAGLTDTQLYEYAYAADFDGAWGWALNGGDGVANLSPGMAAIRGKQGIGIKVSSGSPAPADGCPPPPPPPPPYPPQPTPPCTDTPPAPGTYTCAQQAGWGKCGDDFMKGFCCKSCFKCAGVLQCGGV